MSTASGLEIDRVSWHPRELLERVDRLSTEAAESSGHLLLDIADRHVPYREGTLEASGTVERGDSGEVAVGYRDPVARFVHAHPEWTFEDGRSGRWLEEAMAEGAAEIGGVLAETVRAGWPD